MTASARLGEESRAAAAPQHVPGGLRLMDSCATAPVMYPVDPAAASRAGASLAAVLENSVVTHSQINEWLSSPTRDISARLALFSSLPSDPGSGPQDSSPSTATVA